MNITPIWGQLSPSHRKYNATNGCFTGFYFGQSSFLDTNFLPLKHPSEINAYEMCEGILTLNLNLFNLWTTGKSYLERVSMTSGHL